MNEGHAPDLLLAQQVLLAGLLDHIHSQVRASPFMDREPRSLCIQSTKTVQARRTDPYSSEERLLRTTVMQTEIERVKFIVHSCSR